MSSQSTSAYADVPQSGSGPGVLVLHSWWGLTEEVKDLCNRLADAGYVAMAPDLFDGRTASTVEDGQALLLESDANHMAAGVTSCADALRRMPATNGHAISVIGFSMGASLGLWLSEREAGRVGAVVAYYGSQGIDFTETSAAYLFHIVNDDPMLDPDEVALMEASLGLAGCEIEIESYDGVLHFFAEDGSPTYDPDAAEEAWVRTLAFLDAHRAVDAETDAAEG